MRTNAILLLAVAAFAGPTHSARLGDFDGDGTADVLLRHGEGSWTYHAIDGPSVNRTEAVRITPDVAFYWMGAGDFNGDGRDDAMLRRDDGVWLYYPLDGHRVIAAERGWANLTRSVDFRVVAVADLNHDHRDDVLLRRSDGAWLYYPMNGRRVIAAARGWANLPRNPDWRLAATGDFDGDDQTDVLLRHVDGTWQLYDMNGRRAIARRTPRHLPDDPNWRHAGAGDFNGDGRDTVLVRHATGRWRAVGLHTARAVALDRDWAWRLAGIGDGDGDGRDDVLLRHDDGRWRWNRLAGHHVTHRAPSDLPRERDWQVPTRPVHFPDPILRAAIEAALERDSGALIRRRELAAMDRLGPSGSGIRDLTGIGFATRLRSIRLYGQELDNIAPLAGLVGVRELLLQNNRIHDVTPLAGLRGLNLLVLDDNDIVDIAPLARLPDLQGLYVGQNAITDISPLANATNLDILSLYDNSIADIRPLEHLRGLAILNLTGNRVSDLSPLAALTSLINLLLPYNRIDDISPLAGLTDLETLHLGHNNVDNIAALGGLASLVDLTLGHNNVSDLAPLAGLHNLEALDVAHNDVSDLSPIAGLAALTWLRLNGNHIEDVWPLATLTGLVTLNLNHNRVSDIAVLENLTNLDELHLAHNRIGDLSALANNPGLTVGDFIDLRGNPLTEESLATDVSALSARGVAVYVDRPPGVEFVYDDTVVVLRVEEDLAKQTAYDGLRLDLYAQHLYTDFEDVFDFVMFFSNLDDAADHENLRYYGLYAPVRNDTAGTGTSVFYTNRYGSAEKLKGVIHFPYNRALLEGPSLHELNHAWANYVIPTAVNAHWGFSSANGQLGGFDLHNLVELGGGRYIAGRFGTFANGGNQVPYSPIELYFAGYLPPEEVPDLWVAADGEWVVDDGAVVQTERGDPVFSAPDVQTYSIEDIVDEHGPRVPSMAEAQWHFRVAVVLLVDANHPISVKTLNRLRDDARRFSSRASDASTLYNYFEATRGRGSVTMRGLGRFRKNVPAASDALPASFGTVPAPYATTVDGRCLSLDALSTVARSPTGP